MSDNLHEEQKIAQDLKKMINEGDTSDSVNNQNNTKSNNKETKKNEPNIKGVGSHGAYEIDTPDDPETEEIDDGGDNVDDTPFFWDYNTMGTPQADDINKDFEIHKHSSKNTNSSNPLMNFLRNPDKYIKLPTHGIFNDNKEINFTPNGEVAIYPMTAKDEINLKSPEALMNGEAIIYLIRNCVPDIENPKNIVNPDFNAIMLAIRIVSFGQQMDLSKKCPSCEHENSYGFDLESALNKGSELTEIPYVTIKNGLTVYLKPYTFESSLQASMVSFEQMKQINTLRNSNIPEKEKLSKVRECYNNLDDMRKNVLSDSIIKILTPNNDEITDKSYIHEFLENVDRKSYNQISEKSNEINNMGPITNRDVNCENCGKSINFEITFDPSRFFA